MNAMLPIARRTRTLWTDARVERLCALLRAGATIETAAIAIGLTRGGLAAQIGKMKARDLRAVLHAWLHPLDRFQEALMQITSFFRKQSPTNPARELALIGVRKRRATVAEMTERLRQDIAAGRVSPIAPREVVVAEVRR